MSDIVERLQNMWVEQEPKLLWTDMEAITDEAAEEITRLREENKMAFEAVGDVVKANDDLREKNEKLRIEVMSDYNEGWEEGVKAERERCAKIAEQVRNDTCDGPVAWSMADGIASAIRENE